MGLKEYTIALIFVGLFSIAIISFAIQFGTDNSATVNLGDGNLTDSLRDELRSNITTFNTQSENTYTSMTKAGIEEGDTTPTGGQFTLTPTNILGVVISLVEAINIVIFGGNDGANGFSIFVTTFIGMLVLLSAYYIWKAWAGRSVE